MFVPNQTMLNRTIIEDCSKPGRTSPYIFIGIDPHNSVMFSNLLNILVNSEGYRNRFFAAYSCALYSWRYDRTL